MENLNGVQGRETNRLFTLAGFYEEQKDIYILYAPYADQVKLLLGYRDDLKSILDGKDISGTGITKKKEELKKDVATQGGIICTRVAAYANKIGDIELQTSIYHSASEIKKLKDSDVLGFANRLVTIVTPLLNDELFKTYSVTGQMLTGVTDTAEAFTGKIGKASLEDDKSSIASKSINEILKNVSATVVQLNWLVNFFGEKYPAFVEGYYKAVRIDKTGIHHSGIKGIVTSSASAQAVEKASVILQGKTTKKSTTTDMFGAYEIIKVRSGKCKLIIAAPGYDTQTIEVTIIRGKTLELNIELEAKAINLSATA